MNAVRTIKILGGASALLIATTVALAPVAFAKENGEQDQTRINIGVNADIMEQGTQGSNETESNQGNDNRNESERATSTEQEATSTEREKEQNQEQERSKGEEHRSNVANIVQKLLDDADRDGGIGEEVRAVAQEQASTSIAVAQTMDDLDHESGIKKFFFGPDYKSLGELRSTLVTTQNNIDRLTAAKDNAKTTTTKADLDAQIQALEEVASSTQSFIDEHQNTFSLFGWFYKLFNR